ncbi:RNA-directed DNA polymerase [Roseococcus suduntuyensis]|nr:RNA-directed DNA polymerase [Roseococcus suduntuyensis]
MDIISKLDLLRKGMLPENLPPSFGSHLLGTRLAEYYSGSDLSKKLNKHSPYNASKRGGHRRIFSAIHPSMAYNSSLFLERNWRDVSQIFSQDTFSYSIPQVLPSSRRAVVITSQHEMDQTKLEKLSRYRYIAKTDISRFYHSLYTHTIPWAVHGKVQAKANKTDSLLFNQLDRIFRNGQDGQTIGIPVGPDASRITAEIVSCAIDLTAKNLILDRSATIVRHVDDVWIGAHSYETAESILGFYRTAIQSFELDINESKTKIFDSNFDFIDLGIAEIDLRFDHAVESMSEKPEKVRDALEFALQYVKKSNDDGALKYTLRKIDKWGKKGLYWHIIEPYLLRFMQISSHCCDYVYAILIWRKFTFGAIDEELWSDVFDRFIRIHADLRHDSEIIWTIYAANILEIDIHSDLLLSIMKSGHALSVIAALDHAHHRLNWGAEEYALPFERLQPTEDSREDWPIFYEWKAQEWPAFNRINLQEAFFVESSLANSNIINHNALPLAFANVDVSEYENVNNALDPDDLDYDHKEEIKIPPPF